jgi:hypothetical protein
MAKPPTVEIPIPKTIKREYLEDLGHDIVEFIRQRTESGVGVTESNNSTGYSNKAFPGYSKEYRKSLEFKIAGKSNKVNLTLTGDMLAEMDVLKSKQGSITIGFERGENADKAEGNILGSYGGDPNPKKARNFLGISPSDLKKILAKYED